MHRNLSFFECLRVQETKPDPWQFQIQKRIQQNPIFKPFSSDICKAILIDTINHSGCTIEINQRKLAAILRDYLRIMSIMDDLSFEFINSQEMIHFHKHLKSYCDYFASQHIPISIYNIDSLIVSTLLVASKLTYDLSVHAVDLVNAGSALRIELPSLRQIVTYEAYYLSKVGYDVAVTTLDACNTYSLVKAVEERSSKNRWTHFFDVYHRDYQENKHTDSYSDLFELRPGNRI